MRLIKLLKFISANDIDQTQRIQDFCIPGP